jgi:hypothetical protein
MRDDDAAPNMTARTPRAAGTPDRRTVPAPAEGAKDDFIGENLRRLFDDVAKEGVPDRLSSLLARLAEEDARAARTAKRPEDRE